MPTELGSENIAPTRRPSRYGYCKLYVDTSDVEAVMNAILQVSGEVRSRSTVVAGAVEFDVLRNPDRDASLADDFIHWPVIVDVDAERASPKEAVAAVATVLAYGWEHDMPTVAACDFEDELPWSGGIALADDERQPPHHA